MFQYKIIPNILTTNNNLDYYIQLERIFTVLWLMEWKKRNFDIKW